MKKSFKSNFDFVRYKKVDSIQYVEISGWCFHLGKQPVDFVVEVNGKEVDFSITRMDRNELTNFFNDPTVGRNAGFLLHIDVDGPINSIDIYALSGNEKECIKTYSESKLQRKLDTHLIDYSVDNYERDEKTSLSSIWGWAYAIDHSDIDYRLVDSKGNDVELTFRKLIRSDFFDEFRKNSGYYIVFHSEPKEKYKLIIENNKETREIKLSSAMNASATGIAGYIAKINGKNIRKAGSYIRRNGFRQFVKRLRKVVERDQIDYNVWAKNHSATAEELEKQRQTHFEYEPKISLIVATFNTPLEYLKEMVDTVVEQTYSNWELCIADGSTNDSVQEYVKEHYGDNEKIKFTRLDDNYGIAGNMNKAMELATGDFIALYDHDDTLTLDALYENVKVLNENPELLIIYSDEDKTNLDGTHLFKPHFKPDFNFDLLCSSNYICHFLMVKKTLIDEVGPLNSEYDGAQDYDFVLRCTDAAGPERIHHIPKVLYHWRFHDDSTAANPESKMYAFEAGKRAIQDFYDRKGIHAKVDHSQNLGMYKSTYILDTKPLVSIIIPNKDHIDDLSRCINSLKEKATYQNYEIIVVENNSTEKSTFNYYKEIEKENNIKVVYWDDEFNYSAINNFGVKHAKGEYIWLLNNDTEVINEDIIEQLLGYCMREDVGAVGARLFYPDDTIQHAGVVIGMNGIAGHLFVDEPANSYGYFGRIISAQDLSAVTAACMMVKREAFEEVGGLTEELKVAFNDIDFCLKLGKEGYKVVYNPYAQMYHFESKSRGQENTLDKMDRFNSEIKFFEERWTDILKNGDPYYNPNLSLKYNDYSLKGNDE